jgi:hypothetical protein
MGMLDEMNDAVEIAFRLDGEVIAERTWNYLPAVGDLVELMDEKSGREFAVKIRRFHDRTEGFFSGLGPQKVTLDIIFVRSL